MSSRPRTLVIPILLIALTATVRLIPAAVLHQDRISDFKNMEQMAGAVLRGDNIYARPLLFPYPPYSQYLQGGMKFVDRHTRLRFEFIAKLLPITADCFTTFLLLNAPIASRSSRERRALAWALHPVSILITGFHGNIMPAVAMLILAAGITFDRAVDSSQRSTLVRVSGLLLGLAIAIRSFPILFLPLFLIKLRGLRDRVHFLATGLFATAFSSLPYLLFAPKAFLRESLSYSGWPDFGWAAAIRALIEGDQVAPITDYSPTATKLLFLTAYLVWLFVVAVKPNAIPVTRNWIAVPLLFYCLYSGVGAQYLIWLLPVALAVSDRRMIIFFSVGSTAALIGFYAIYHPGILFGQFPPMFGGFPGSGLAKGLWFAGNVVLVGTCLHWIMREYRFLLGKGNQPFVVRAATLAFIAVFACWAVLVSWKAFTLT